MEYLMRLHEDKQLFNNIIRAAAQHYEIRTEFVEKDYWITLMLSLLANSQYATQVVFKGGTSLSKGFRLIERFSEDVDLAVLMETMNSGNVVKNLIREVEKTISKGFKNVEILGVTSKGSRFRKTVLEYDSIEKQNLNNRLIMEINSFANPYPHQSLRISSLAADFLEASKNFGYMEKYGLTPFNLNVLRKEQTLVEKVVSLIRCSFDENPIESISNKIRHFYDLYFLVNDPVCHQFIRTPEFKVQFAKVLQHDQSLFEEPLGWRNKQVHESVLFLDFEGIWSRLSGKYQTELSAFAYKPIPDERLVAIQVKELLNFIS
jgi:predicted nucleotidyltransferase component of viral defense system